MENNISSAEDLKTIRKIMEDSTKFLSLSGLSGIFMGLFAIAGAMIAIFLIPGNWMILFNESLKTSTNNGTSAVALKLILDALVVLVLSVISAFYFSFRKARRSGKAFWTPVSKRLLLNLFIPLIAGGTFALILIIQRHGELIIPVFLIFYGLALINAGKFTYSEIFYLGISEIFTGLVAAIFPDLGLLFWIIGFGILHIVYGVMMYRKYEV